MHSNKTILLIIMAIWGVVGVPVISLDLDGSEAILYKGQGLLLKVRCTGGTGAYQYFFAELPLGWIISQNGILVTNFSPFHSQKWRLNLEIVDTAGNFLKQTIMISFVGYYVSFTPVTLPLTGRKSSSSNTNSLSSYFFTSQASDQVQGSSSFTRPSSSSYTAPTSTNNFGLNDLVGVYPGISPTTNYTSAEPTGFGINYGIESSLIPELIANTQASYDPIRDSRQPSVSQLQRDAALRRQSNANKAVANLIAIIQRLSSSIQKTEDDLAIKKEKLENFTKEVKQCNDELFKLEDTKTRIMNAISDKQSQLGQFKNQLKNVEKQLKLEEEALRRLNNDKQQTELNSLPNSRALSRLQDSLVSCENNLAARFQKIRQIQVQIQQNQSQIKLTSIQINEAKQTLSTLDMKLGEVRAKIVKIEEELKQAKTEEAQIIAEKHKYEQIPIMKQGQIIQLQTTTNSLKKLNKAEEAGLLNCDGYRERIQTIQSIVNKNKQQYDKIVEEIIKKQKYMEQLKQSLSQSKKSSNILPLEITSLRQELSKYQNQIRRANYLCEDFRNELIQIQNQINTLSNSRQQYARNLQEARINLNKARAEQQLANKAVDQLMPVRTQNIEQNIQISYASNDQMNENSEDEDKQRANGPSDQPPNQPSLPNNSFSISLEPVIDEEITVDFQLQSKSTLNHITVGDPRQYFIQKYGIDIGEGNHGQKLYKIDASSRSDLIVTQASMTLGLSSFICDENYPGITSASMVITDVGFGTITGKSDGGIIYQLTLSGCTKVVSTEVSTNIVRGRRILFKGVQLFTLSGSILFNAYLIISVPQYS